MGAPLDPEIPSWVTDGPPLADIEGYLDVRKKATAAKQAKATTGSAPEPQPQPQPRPVITVRGGGLSDEASAGERAIVSAGEPIYQRAQSLVRPVIEEVDAAHGRRTKVAQLARVETPYMRDLLCRTADWQKWSGRRKDYVQVDSPGDVAQTILHRRGEWTFPTVIGVVTTPTMRPDGSLLLQPGYDPATRLILMEPPPMPAIPESPTRADGLAALAVLDDLLAEFPFNGDEASRSVALSALITPVVRGAFPVTPLHAVSAPTPGSGKSYLLDAAAAIAIGQPCPVMAAGRTEEETEKRLVAAVLAGQPIINIDNVNGDLGGDALCQIIERPIVELRPLGKSERVRVESRSTLFASGNNIRLVGDMTRRVMLCRLDANLERPELRQFLRNPVAEVLADRGRFVAAALTVARAYVIARRPNPAPRLASFEAWSNLVRSALIWLGRTDPVETMKAARDDDPEFRTMAAIFSALHGAIGAGVQKTASEIVGLACARTAEYDDQGYATEAPDWQFPDLREALISIPTKKTGLIDNREVGKWLSRRKGRIANGLRLQSYVDDNGHPAIWWLDKVDCGSRG
jgi:hypothetical protein